MPLCNNLSIPKHPAPFKGVLLCCDASVYHTSVRYLNHATGCIYTAECLCVPTPGNSWLCWPDLASCGDLAREQQVWGTGSGAEDADLPKSVEQLVGFEKTGQTNETVVSHCQGEVGIIVFFPDVGLKTCLLSANKMHLISRGQAPCEQGESEGSGTLWQMVCVSLLTCVLTTCCVNAERRRMRRRKKGGGGSFACQRE